MFNTCQKACEVMYSLVVTLENSQCVYYAILVIWLSPIYTNQKLMDFHLKGDSALIWQIFSCFNWKIGNFLQIFCFFSVRSTKFARFLDKFAKLTISKPRMMSPLRRDFSNVCYWSLCFKASLVLLGLPWAPVNNHVNSGGGQITLFCRLKQDEDPAIEKIPNQYAPTICTRK